MTITYLSLKCPGELKIYSQNNQGQDVQSFFYLKQMVKIQNVMKFKTFDVKGKFGLLLFDQNNCVHKFKQKFQKYCLKHIKQILVNQLVKPTEL